MHTHKGDQLFQAASKYFISGVGAAGRFFPTIGRPLFLERADGAYLFDIDGNQYIDYHSSSGATFLGYNNPEIKQAMLHALDLGYFCNYETAYHVKLAELLCASVPCAEKVRFANTGTEATLAAIRLARGVTGRKKIIKFEGHFHGMHEMAWFNCHTALPEPNEYGEIPCIPDSAGIPEEIASMVIVLPSNEPDIFRACMKRHQGEIAAVIMEPVMYNAGCVLPRREFVQAVRDETERAGTVLIFDEVLSGFRMCLGGGQEYLGVTPDLTTLAKALGGSGVPIAALVGKEWVMKGLNPVGKTVMSGTYTGHILEVLGALKAVEIMRSPGFYDHLNQLADRLYSGMAALLQQYRIKAVLQGVGARFAIYFGLEHTPIYDYREVVRHFDFDMNQRFLRKAFEKYLYIHDYGNKLSPTHHGFTSAHTLEDIEETLTRCEDVFKTF